MNENNVTNVSRYIEKERAYPVIVDSVWENLKYQATCERDDIRKIILAKPRVKKIMAVIRYNVQRKMDYSPNGGKTGNTVRRASARIAGIKASRRMVNNAPAGQGSTSTSSSPPMMVPTETMERMQKQQEFVEYVAKCYEATLHNYGLKPFTPMSEIDAKEVKDYLARDVGHTYTPLNVNPTLARPDILNCKGVANQAYTNPGSCRDGESEVFMRTLQQLEAGSFPPLYVKQTTRCGEGLYASADIDGGTVMCNYSGTLGFNFNTSPKYPTPGYDKCITLIEHKYESHDICVNPQDKGGLSHFAFSARPTDKDYEFCNAFLHAKVVEVPDRTSFTSTPVKEVHLFLVSTRKIPKGHPVIWFYGYPFFHDLEEQMGDDCPNWLSVKEIYEMSGLPRSNATRNKLLSRKRGRPRTHHVSRTSNLSTRNGNKKPRYSNIRSNNQDITAE